MSEVKRIRGEICVQMELLLSRPPLFGTQPEIESYFSGLIYALGVVDNSKDYIESFKKFRTQKLNEAKQPGNTNFHVYFTLTQMIDLFEEYFNDYIK